MSNADTKFPISLVIADNYPLIVYALEQLFTAQEDFTILASHMDGESALESVRVHQPDVLILDLKLPRLNGLEVLRQLRQEGLTTPVIACTTESVDEKELIELIQLGGCSIVLKNIDPDHLLKAVRVAHEGGEWLEKQSFSRAFDKMLQKKRPSPLAELTARELQLVRLLAQDFSNGAIAKQLHITEGTVKVHLYRIFKKLGVTSRLGLVMYAMEKKWL